MQKCLLHFLASFMCTLCFFQTLIAQNTSPYWSLAGNSNASNTTSKLGTTNAINLRLFTNNVERVRILSTNGNVGIGTTAPTDRLHINTPSGTNALRVQVNAATKLLVHSSGGTAIGANQTPPANGLYVSGNVGIGTNTPAYKLHVAGNANITNGLTVAENGIVARNTTNSSTGIQGFGIANGMEGYGSGTFSTGVYGLSPSIGVWGNSTGAGGYGVYGSGTAYGLYGTSTSGKGMYAESVSDAGVHGYSTNNIGGYFETANGNGLWSKTGSTASWAYAGVFEGNVIAYGVYQTSDKNLKKNITDMGSALPLLNKLKPKDYEFITEGKYAALTLPKGKHYGFLAQELETVLPELVREAPREMGKAATPPAKREASTTPNAPAEGFAGLKAVNYTELIPIIVKGMQELDAKTKEIEDLKARIEKLETLLHVKAGTITSATLGQASPNPARTSTRIAYTLPADAVQAQLQVFDNNGKLLKAVSLRASGTLDLNTAALSGGVYNYSLLVDGKILETKKLTVAR